MSLAREVICLFIFFVFYSPSVLACKPYMTGRSDTIDQLIDRTETIVIAKVKSYKKNNNLGFNRKEKFDYVMDVTAVLKGNKKKKEINLKEFDAPEDSNSKIEVGLDCYNHGGFKKNNLYLVFVGSAHPKAYKIIDGENDPWLLEVKSKIKKDK